MTPHLHEKTQEPLHEKKTGTSADFACPICWTKWCNECAKFFIEAFAFQFQCRWLVSWRWWTLLPTVRVLVFSHLLTSAVSPWHQFDVTRSTASGHQHEHYLTSTMTTTDGAPEAIDFYGIIAKCSRFSSTCSRRSVDQQCVRQCYPLFPKSSTLDSIGQNFQLEDLVRQRVGPSQCFASPPALEKGRHPVRAGISTRSPV